MRSTIVPRQRRVVAQLCSACRRDAMQTASRPFSSASRSPAAASRAHKLGGGSSSSNNSQVVAPLSARRWLSHTSRRPQQQPPKAATAEQRRQQDQGAEGPTASSAPESSSLSVPSFYALFPTTLPKGPPPSGPFHIDPRALRNEFLRLQAAAHPDLNHGGGGGGGGSGSSAGAASALINEAYRTLVSPLPRAQYLMRERFGLDVAGDEAGELWVPEPEVLAAVMEARETIEEATEEAELVGLRQENEERISGAEEVLGEAFASGDVEAAKKEVVRLRYWMNVRESIDNWESGKPVVLEH